MGGGKEGRPPGCVGEGGHFALGEIVMSRLVRELVVDVVLRGETMGYALLIESGLRREL